MKWTIFPILLKCPFFLMDVFSYWTIIPWTFFPLVDFFSVDVFSVDVIS